MIDWPIILGALACGVALTCWLESRHRLMQAQIFSARFLQGTAVFCTFLAAGMFFSASKQSDQQFIDRANGIETAVLTSTPPHSPTLAPPSVFILSTPIQAGTNQATPKSTTTNPSYLHIPDLNISQQIIDLPLQNGIWNVSQLGEKIGHLASTGTHPGDTLAPVFAGHMTFPNANSLETGAFANLQYATYDTEIHYETIGEHLIYKITEISRVAPTEVEQLYLEDGDSILLTTCTDWDENGRFYTNRLLIRATLQ